MLGLSLISMTNTFMYVFRKLSTFDASLIEDSLSNIENFMSYFKDVETKAITDLNEIFVKFVDNMSDQIKWKRIQNNLKIIKDQFGGIATNINKIDMRYLLYHVNQIANRIKGNPSK